MTWQTFTTTNPTGSSFYRNTLVQIVQVATSSHVATVANIDGGSTGYTVGDILTYTHASATHDATFEVLTIGGGGDITSLRIVNGGAFGRRVATVTKNAGGSNYAVGDILELATGANMKSRAKARVATLSGSAVATVTLFEGGGNYEGGTDPTTTGGATTLIGPSGGTGSGCTIDVTMQAITGTSNWTLTGGTGTGAQIDVTLAHSGWSTLRDDNNFSNNSVLTEKQVAMQGTVTGGDAPIILMVTYTVGTTTHWGISLNACDAYNDGLALSAQVGVNTNGSTPATGAGAYVPSLDEAEAVWLSVSSREIHGVLRTVGNTVTAYHSFYLGLLDPFGTTTESPYPMFIAGSTWGTNRWTHTSTASIDLTSYSECFDSSGASSGPQFYRRIDTGAYQITRNGSGSSFPLSSPGTQYLMFPIGAPALAPNSTDLDNIAGPGNFAWFNTICQNTGVTATLTLLPAPGTNEHLMLPLTIERRETLPSPEFGTLGRLHNAYWIGATKSDGTSLLTSETKVTDPTTGKVYRVFQSGVRGEAYSFHAMEEV